MGKDKNTVSLSEIRVHINKKIADRFRKEAEEQKRNLSQQLEKMLEERYTYLDKPYA